METKAATLPLADLASIRTQGLRLCDELGCYTRIDDAPVFLAKEVKAWCGRVQEAFWPSETNASWFWLLLVTDYATCSPNLATRIGSTLRYLNTVLAFGLRQYAVLTTEQEQQYEEKLLQNEESCRAWRADRSNPISMLARQLCRRATYRADLTPDNVGRLGRHGPGAVFDGSVGSDKNAFAAPSSRQLAKSYPYSTFFVNEEWAADHSRGFGGTVRFLPNDDGYSRCDFEEARITLVPKDYKGPRGVFVSSKEAMFCQLGQLGALNECLSRSWVRECYTPESQLPSQRCVEMGTMPGGGECCTLDLSDASDRVPLSLAAFLFHRETYLSLARTRPTYLWYPSGHRRRMAMFAPMGDGKTFVVLSLVCACITVATILHKDGYRPGDRKLSEDSIRRAARKCRIYGDDIIVDKEYASAVVEALEDHNLKVNHTKSFLNGNFRESCGVEYFKDTNVTPLRVPRGLNLDDHSKDNILKMVAWYNRVATQTCGIPVGRLTYTLLAQIEGTYWGKRVAYTHTPPAVPQALYLPLDIRKDDHVTPTSLFVPPSDNLLLRNLRKLGAKAIRFNLDLQRWEVRTVSETKEEFLNLGDPWWDFQYAMRRSANSTGPVPYAAFERVTSVGSKSGTALYEKYRRRAGILRAVKRCSTASTMWVPVT